MRVELSTALFPEPPSAIELNALAFLALKGRHRLFISNDMDSDFQAWLNGLPVDQNLEWSFALSEAFELEAREPSKRALLVTAGGDANWTSDPPSLPLSAAVDYLNKPVLTFLEDWSSDKTFLFAIAQVEQRNYIKRMEERGAIQFENGGGISNMPKRIQSLRSDPGIRHRVWALFDGDGMQPGTYSGDSIKLRTVCDAAGIPYHQLSRRSIENYLTPEVLQKWAAGQNRAERVRKIRAFARMTSAQRWHFNMKDGFAQDRRRTDSTAGSLYDGLVPRDVETLEGGFGTAIAELYSRESLPENDLRADGSWEEMNALVSGLVEFIR